jgi:hypothetical protein
LKGRVQLWGHSLKCGIGWGHNRVQFGILGMPFTRPFYPSWHPEVKVIINLNIHRSWGIGWGEILYPLYLKSGKAYKCRVMRWEQGVLEMPFVGSCLKGSYFRNSLLPGVTKCNQLFIFLLIILRLCLTLVGKQILFREVCSLRWVGRYVGTEFNLRT